MSQSPPRHLRRDAEHLAGALPPLLLAAERLASSVSLGVHGRRQAGMGESFWQYRQALPGDEIAAVDWRRSGRSDTVYIREREWEAAHTVAIWADDAQSMDYRSRRGVQTKHQRANLLALALAVLLNKAGERVAFPDTPAGEPRHGARHLHRITQALATPRPARPEYGCAPDTGDFKPAGTILFSDFLGPEAGVFTALRAAQSGGAGYIVQILDESEESFPFDGRVVFESMGGALAFETHRARSLQPEYRARLAERCEALEAFARKSGWHYLKHHTGENAQQVLLTLYMGLYMGMGAQG